VWLSRFNNGWIASPRLLINYMSARHPMFQVQVDGWESAHDKWFLFSKHLAVIFNA
jgi:hypothetical protein